MDCLVEYLPGMHKAWPPSLTPNIQCVGMQAFAPSIQEEEAGGWIGGGHPLLWNELEANLSYI